MVVSAKELNICVLLSIEDNVEKRSNDKRSHIRMKVSRVARHGISLKRLLSIINDLTNDRTISIGDIEMTQKFSFFNVEADQVDQLMDAFQGQNEIILSIMSNEKPRTDSQRNRKQSPPRKK